jgi:hypothetical protein
MFAAGMFLFVLPLLFFLIVGVLLVGFVLLKFLKYLSATTAPPAMSGNVLASGNGQGNSALTLNWAIAIISAIVACSVGIFAVVNTSGHHEVAMIATDSGVSLVEKVPKLAIVGGGLIFLAILCPVFGVLYHIAIVGTHIQVDENGITGKGVGSGFLWGDSRRFGFRLAYNQITSVDVAGSNIIRQVP